MKKVLLTLICVMIFAACSSEDEEKYTTIDENSLEFDSKNTKINCNEKPLAATESMITDGNFIYWIALEDLLKCDVFPLCDSISGNRRILKNKSKMITTAIAPSLYNL